MRTLEQHEVLNFYNSIFNRSHRRGDESAIGHVGLAKRDSGALCPV